MSIAYYTVLRIRYEYRKSRAVNADGPAEGTVYAMIYLEGQEPVLQSTGVRCSAADWSEKNAPRRSASAKDVAEKLVLWERSVLSAARTLTDRGDAVTVGALMDEKNFVRQPLLTLQSAIEKFLIHKRSLIGPDDAAKRAPGQITYDTFRTYGTRRAWLTAYLVSLRHPAYLLLKVDAPFVERYHTYLTRQPKLGAAYATKCVKLLTEICQWAFRQGLIRELKTGGFRGSTASVAKPYNLTESDIEALEALKLSATLSKVRDGFLLARELCLHYGDYRSLKAADFVRDKNGRLLLDKPRQKQEAGRDIRLLSRVPARAERIWNQYGQKIPAKMVAPTFRRYLKEIGAQAGLERELCFSHARDSGIFALVAAKRSDAEIRLAAGWTTTRQLIRYVSHNRVLLEEMA